MLQVCFRKQHDELFTAESSNSINVAHITFDYVCHVFDSGIAVVVAQAVVDLFEVIQVDNDGKRMGDRIVGNDRFLCRVVLENIFC